MTGSVDPSIVRAALAPAIDAMEDRSLHAAVRMSIAKLRIKRLDAQLSQFEEHQSPCPRCGHLLHAINCGVCLVVTEVFGPTVTTCNCGSLPSPAREALAAAMCKILCGDGVWDEGEENHLRHIHLEEADALLASEIFSQTEEESK